MSCCDNNIIIKAILKVVIQHTQYVSTCFYGKQTNNMYIVLRGTFYWFGSHYLLILFFSLTFIKSYDYNTTTIRFVDKLMLSIWSFQNFEVERRFKCFRQ